MCHSRPPPTISFKDNWIQELDSEVAGSSKDTQRIQPKPKHPIIKYEETRRWIHPKLRVDAYEKIFFTDKRITRQVTSHKHRARNYKRIALRVQTSMSEIPFHIVGRWTVAISASGPRQFKQRHCHGACCCAGKQGTPTKSPGLLCAFPHQRPL